MSKYLSGSVICPKCAYGDCTRIQRNFLDKILKYSKKYRCMRCGYTFFINEKR